MAALGDNGQVFGAGEVGGDVATDDVVAEAQPEDGRGDGPGDVDREDAAHIRHRDLGALGIGDGDGQLRLRVVVDGGDRIRGQAGGGAAGRRADVRDEVESGERLSKPVVASKAA